MLLGYKKKFLFIPGAHKKHKSASSFPPPVQHLKELPSRCAEGGFSFFDLSCSLAGTWHLL
jgi:hypothetical protein